MRIFKNIKTNWMQATLVCILLIILIGGVKMSETIYGFKNDKCKIPIGTII